MASDTDTRRAELHPAAGRLKRALRRIKPYVASRIALAIGGVNAAAAAILLVGFFSFIETRQVYANAEADALNAQARLLIEVLKETAVDGDPAPRMNSTIARQVVARLDFEGEPRAIVYDVNGTIIADTDLIGEVIRSETLPPPGARPMNFDLGDLIDDVAGGLRWFAMSPVEQEAFTRSTLEDVRGALAGEQSAGVRLSAGGERVVRVAHPLREVAAVVGAVVFESRDLDALSRAERAAMVPFAGFAFLVILATAVGLTIYLAAPLRRLADGARAVRLAGGRRVPLPDLGGRRDEIGDLGRAFNAMTEALYDRLDAIESFAADVAHEIKNPLASIQSAAEVLQSTEDPERRARLLGVIEHDVRRLDRLITDISNASRLEAELSRADPETVDLARVLDDLARIQNDQDARGVSVRVICETDDPRVRGHESPIGRVFMNLLDNAATFSVTIERTADPRPGVIVHVDDDGPGIPEENLEAIFSRFYTSRPDGAAFGAHSGLGLAIARQIVLAHGGEIVASNRRGEGETPLGARFSVTLPAATR